MFKDGDPVLIDVGKATYTRAYFSAQADSISVWNCQSSCHNLPRINGQDQSEGKDFKAKNVSYSFDENRLVFSLDISDAYPKESAVNSWYRTIKLEGGKSLTVIEKYDLNSYVSPSVLYFMTSVKPEMLSEGVIRIGSSILSFSPGILSS